MTIPSRADFLAEIDRRLRVRFPDAPEHLDTGNPAHAEMIEWWGNAHNTVLYEWTDSVFFQYYPAAPKRLDPNNSNDETLIEFWNDIARQIRDGTPGKYNWSGEPTTAAADEVEEPEPVAQDGSVRLEDRIEYVRVMLQAYVEVIVGTEIAQPAIEHVAKQIDVLRGLVKDGTFKTYSHWWRSAEYAGFAHEDGDPTKEEIASIRDLTLEAKIDRSDGALDTHLAGWAKNNHGGWFGRVSRANE
ncbi:MAG TPA: hypothetical protein VGQ20_09730 [Acidimicrobiales bacterium]|jgi:hypothetical protein|nr:hypothetical protein [Acidimicrobiales bacterium]